MDDDVLKFQFPVCKMDIQIPSLLNSQNVFKNQMKEI